MKEPPFPVVYRLAEEGDLGFVFDSWLRSYKADKIPHKKGRELRKFFEVMRTRIAGLLERSIVMVCCNPDEQAQIFGWAACEKDTCHYVYVKRAYRKMGIAGMLVLPRTQFTHVTKLALEAFPQLEYIGTDGMDGP
jgi:hypothetical protein